jgi:DNA ligase D-like protein (predicted 3'-phosphoesterase)
MLSVIDILLEEEKTLTWVIQKHDAIRAGTHYDIRLEQNGVLKSWASKKLPDLISNKSKKILAVKQPDHNLSWADFSGEITDGYGAGKVTKFDSGLYKLRNSNDSKIINFTILTSTNNNFNSGNYSLIQFDKENKNNYLLIRS